MSAQFRRSEKEHSNDDQHSVTDVVTLHRSLFDSHSLRVQINDDTSVVEVCAAAAEKHVEAALFIAGVVRVCCLSLRPSTWAVDYRRVSSDAEPGIVPHRRRGAANSEFRRQSLAPLQDRRRDRHEVAFKAVNFLDGTALEINNYLSALIFSYRRREFCVTPDTHRAPLPLPDPRAVVWFEARGIRRHQSLASSAEQLFYA